MKDCFSLPPALIRQHPCIIIAQGTVMGTVIVEITQPEGSLRRRRAEVTASEAQGSLGGHAEHKAFSKKAGGLPVPILLPFLYSFSPLQSLNLAMLVPSESYVCGFVLFPRCKL